jgi:hypothetical protein
MGGEESGVSEATDDILLEVAYFTSERIARTGQALALTSDARSRFERGVDPGFLEDGLSILTSLIFDICGGEASSVLRAGEPPMQPKLVPFDPARTEALGGLQVSEERQRAILSSLGFQEENGAMRVPSWRRDMDGPADLVEEVARMEGLDRIDAARAKRRRCAADSHPCPAGRAAGAAHGGSARPQRGCDLELYFGSTGERRRRRSLAACEPDQRRHEGHATVPSAGSDCRRPA